MNDQTTLADAVARAFRDHGITAALTALIGGTIALIAAITRKAFTNEALLDRLDRELIADRDRIDRQRSEDRKADGGFGGRHGQHEKHEHLSRCIPEEAREGHEIDVHRQQHQLHAQQQHDDVLAVDEDARDADGEQQRAEREVVAERDHGARSLVTGSILTMRRRSALRTSTCAAGS